MILDRNMFVERVLPGSVLRKLTEGRDDGVSPAVSASQGTAGRR